MCAPFLYVDGVSKFLHLFCPITVTDCLRLFFFGRPARSTQYVTGKLLEATTQVWKLVMCCMLQRRHMEGRAHEAPALLNEGSFCWDCRMKHAERGIAKTLSATVERLSTLLRGSLRRLPRSPVLRCRRRPSRGWRQQALSEVQDHWGTGFSTLKSVASGLRI